MDVLLPVRDPGRVQPLRRRLDGAVPRDRRSSPKALIEQAAEQQQITPKHPDAARRPRQPDALQAGRVPPRRSRRHENTFSRPYTSSDNPYCEAHFKTLKYRPEFPDRFDSIQHAREHCRAFFDWYNHQHRHSGIGSDDPRRRPPRPGDRLYDAARARVLDAAYARNPERFVRKPPVPPELPTAAWINKPDDKEVAH